MRSYKSVDRFGVAVLAALALLTSALIGTFIHLGFTATVVA
jgi:hypothetical protein